MKRIRLFIARHGETDYNRKGLLQGRGIDAPLNDTGKDQARQLAGYLKNYKTKNLYCSSLRRTWQTARPYQDIVQSELFKKRDLDEMDFGDFEGVSYDEAAPEIGELQNIWERGETSVKIPGGESPEEVFQRANNSVEESINSSNSDIMIFILHGRLIRILLSEWLGYGLKNMQKIEHQNGAVNQLMYENGSFNSVYLNKTDHLLTD